MSYETRLQEITERVAAYLFHFLGDARYNFKAKGYEVDATDRVLSFQMREYAYGQENLKEVALASMNYVAARREVQLLPLGLPPEVEPEHVLELTARNIVFRTGDFTGAE